MRFAPPADPAALVERRLTGFLDIVFDPQYLEKV
jgi:hypothetical protein